MRYRPHIIAALFFAVAILCWWAAGAAAWFSYDVTRRIPGPEALRDLGDMAQATTIFDAKDRPVFTVFKEQRIEEPLRDMSPTLRKAVLAIEDQRFYEHGGIDLVRIAGSAVTNLRLGRRAQGGSTITQQLARQSLLSRDKTYRRKIKEAILASRIEHRYSKDEILELYLNKVYFGDGLYGAEAASRGFFGTSSRDLDVAQAALLAGLIQSPSSYAPTINLERAIARRNVVLQAMLTSGAITKAEYDQARAERVALKNTLQKDETFGAYFKEEVRRDLVDRFGWQRVYQGGLQVYTTLDSEMQEAAERTLEEGLQQIEKRRDYKHVSRATVQNTDPDAASSDYLQGALLAMDPSNGHVAVMIGGRDFERSHFNRATQARRQPGSAFKPFVFAAALENGFTPATLITNLNDPVLTETGEEYMPEDEHSTADSMTLRSALRMSSNRAAVQLLRQVGIARAVSYAKKLDIGTVPSVPSLALGSGEVTLQSLTSAYASFANGGTVHKPVLIRRVTDMDGTVLFEEHDESHRAISQSTAFMMANMLADVINAGTAYRARREGFTLPAAGKTGTTNDFDDAWFVGFTPSLVAGVWVGFDQPQTIVREGFAGDLAVPIWARFMKAATRGAKPAWLERPSDVVGVNVCRMSGKLPNEGCTSVAVEDKDGMITTRNLVYTEYFKKGTQPTDMCPLHPAPSFLNRIAGLFGADGEKPVSSDATGVPGTSTGGPAPPSQPGVAATSGQSQQTAQGDENTGEKKKKRGFWSKLFGVGKDDKKKEEPKKPGGGQ